MRTNPQTLIVSMPIYNAEATLEMAIESVLNQSYRNLHLILVDDNSTDRSLEIAKKYLDNPRVTILHNSQNMGAYYSRNAGLAWVKDYQWGYFTTHDSDDLSFEHRYLKLLRRLRNPSNMGVYDSFRRVDWHTKEFIRQHLTIAHAIFKREVFNRLGYFEEARFGADWEYWKRMLAYGERKGWRMIPVDIVMGEAYVHGKNITVQIPQGSKARKAYMINSRKKIKQRAIQSDWYESFEIRPITKEIL